MNSDLITTIKEKYPNSNSAQLAKELGLSIYQLRKMVSKHQIKKSKAFKDDLQKDLKSFRKLAYTKNIKSYTPTQVQENILIGSLLGDGSLARYGRSKEAYYREHGCKAQADYRAWKSQELASLDFSFFPNHKYPSIKSPCNPLYSDYYKLVYPNDHKKISQKLLSKLNHPLGLLCLYLDDGSLVIDRYIRQNIIHLFPRITIYSQSFTHKENALLLDHIKNTFGIQFILKKRKDGHGTVLQCNYRDDISKFLNLIQIQSPLLECMRYKLDLEYALNTKAIKYKDNFPNHQIRIDRFNT